MGSTALQTCRTRSMVTASRAARAMIRSTWKTIPAAVVTLGLTDVLCGCAVGAAGSPAVGIYTAANPVQERAAPASSPVPEIERGRRLLDEGKVDQAVAILREAVRRQPDSGEAQLLLGRALALVPDLTNAIAALRRAVELQPESAEAHYTLGTALARFADPEAAQPAFEKAVALAPEFAEAHVSLALVLAQRREVGRAREHLARAIEIQAKSPAAAYTHYLMAQILREQQDPKKALEHAAAAIELRRTYAEAYLLQGLLKNQLADARGALQAFEAAVRFAPDDPQARSELGAAYLRDRRADEAVEHLEYAARLRPADRATLNHLCRALQIARRADEARECAQKLAGRIDAGAAASEFEAAEANNQGVELEAAGQVAEALERYQMAVELQPHNTVFRRNLALALCRLGRWEEGVVELERILEADPDDETASRALYIARDQLRRRTGGPR